tara:strand:+ start:10089 stop:10352 length:264 start_codon:yes stop_codon:yes gene_type:complete
MIKFKDLMPVEETVADEDMTAANNLKPRLLQAYNVISTNIKDIEKTLSGFNSPGLKAAFLDSIKKSIKGNKFDIRAAEKHLSKYYKR